MEGGILVLHSEKCSTKAEESAVLISTRRASGILPGTSRPCIPRRPPQLSRTVR